MNATSPQREPLPLDEKTEARYRSAEQASFRLGVLSLGSGSIVTIVVLTLEAVIIARTLSVEDLGLFAFFQAALALLVIVVDFGFRTSAAQLIARRKGFLQERITNGLTTMRFAALAGASLVLLLGRIPIARLFNAPRMAELLLFMPAVLVFASLDELQGSLLRGFGRYQRVAGAGVLRGALRLVISSLVLLALGWGLKGLVASWVVSYAAATAYQWNAVPVRRRLWFRWGWARPVLRFGMPLQLIRYVWFASARIQTFILALLVGPVAVAFYEVAARFPRGLRRLSQSLHAVYHPTIAKNFARQEIQAAATLMQRSLRLFYFATILVAWGAVLFGKELITLLFGEQYGAATPAFIILLLSLSLSASADLYGYALTSLGHPEKSLHINLLRAAASVVGGFLLIPRFGFTGAAMAVAASQLISAPLAWLNIHRQGLPAYVGIHVRQMFLVSVCVAATILLPPLGVIIRLVLFLVFMFSAAAFLSVSQDDLALVLPERLLQRAWPRALTPGPLEGSGE